LVSSRTRSPSNVYCVELKNIIKSPLLVTVWLFRNVDIDPCHVPVKSLFEDFVESNFDFLQAAKPRNVRIRKIMQFIEILLIELILVMANP